MRVFKTLLKWLGIVVGGFFLIGTLVAIFGDNVSRVKPTDATNTQNAEARFKSTATAVSPSKPDSVDWNFKDPDVRTNGNISLALKHLKINAHLRSNGNISDASQVIKSPWKYYGQTLCFIGKVTAVQDYPAGGDISKRYGGGEISEVSIFTEDLSAVSLLSTGGSGTLGLGQSATVCGLPVGRVHGKNALGGDIISLSIVGFVFQPSN